MTLYGYKVYQSKMWDSHMNRVLERKGFLTAEDARAAMEEVKAEISDSEDVFVNDYDVFSYEEPTQ
jgi:hypothetical protein